MFFFQAEDGIRDLVRSRGLGDVYKRQHKIVENIDKFHQHFPGRDDQDYMAMTLIDFITSSNNNLSQSKNDQEIVKKIEHINQLLDQ